MKSIYYVLAWVLASFTTANAGLIGLAFAGIFLASRRKYRAAT